MNRISESDLQYMKRALRLAEKACGSTSPNPMVGAVMVKNGKIIAEDYHRKAGEPHAEALVIAKAGRAARGASLYVTLEPCCHTDKRTPPCSRSIIEAGLKKVFIAMKDPNPKVSGRGIQELKEHGISVLEGILEDKAQRLNEAYRKYVLTRRPFVTLKAAMTLDGKIATPEGRSKWITGEKARRIVHKMRCCSDAVMTAIGTVRLDNPELTSRIGCKKQPLRIVIDPELATPLDYKVCTVPPETIFVVNELADKAKIAKLQARGIRFLIHSGQRADMDWLMIRLGEMAITSVLVEGGSSFNATCLMQNVVDKAVFFISPKIICGKTSIPVVGGNAFLKLEDAVRLTDVQMRKIDEDIMISGYVRQLPQIKV